jgi:hypothetical protein
VLEVAVEVVSLPNQLSLGRHRWSRRDNTTDDTAQNPTHNTVRLTTLRRRWWRRRGWRWWGWRWWNFTIPRDHATEYSSNNASLLRIGRGGGGAAEEEEVGGGGRFCAGSRDRERKCLDQDNSRSKKDRHNGDAGQYEPRFRHRNLL